MSADWAIRWGVIAAFTLVDAVWMWAKGIGFAIRSLGAPLAMAAIFLACSLVCSVVARNNRRLSSVLLGSADYLHSVTQLMLMILPLVTLTYLAATANLPLADGLLGRADALIGFDWPAASAWVASYPVGAEILRLSYQTIEWQLFVVLFLVSVNRPGEANSEFIWNFLVSLLLATAVSAVLPALGYDGVIGAAHIDVLRQVREGAWTTLDLNTVDGIVTFPSFHAALGVLFVYSARHVRWALWALAPLNALMILSTPTVGGHYLVDAIAGCLIAWLSIALVRPLRAWTARLRLQRIAWSLGTLHPAAGQKG